MPDSEGVALLLDRIQGITDPEALDWYHALLCASLDEGLDLRQALSVADDVFGQAQEREQHVRDPLSVLLYDWEDTGVAPDGKRHKWRGIPPPATDKGTRVQISKPGSSGRGKSAPVAATPGGGKQPPEAKPAKAPKAPAAPKAPKAPAAPKATKPAKPAPPSVDEIHAALEQARKDPSKVTAEHVKGFAAQLALLKGDEIKALRQRSVGVKGSGSKDVMIQDLFKRLGIVPGAKPPEPPKVEKPTPASTAQTITDAIHDLAGEDGTAILSDLRRKVGAGVSREDFDRTILDLANKDVLMVLKDDHPGIKTPDQLAEEVRGPDGNYYMAVAFRGGESSIPPRSAKPPAPGESAKSVHPLAGKSKDEMVRELLDKGSHTQRESNPWKLKPLDPAGVVPGIVAAVQAAQAKNSFVRPKIGELYDAVGKPAGLSLGEFQDALFAGQQSGELRLDPHTEAVTSASPKDLAHMIPLDRERKLYVDLGTKAPAPARPEKPKPPARVEKKSLNRSLADLSWDASQIPGVLTAANGLNQSLERGEPLGKILESMAAIDSSVFDPIARADRSTAVSYGVSRNDHIRGLASAYSAYEKSRKTDSDKKRLAETMLSFQTQLRDKAIPGLRKLASEGKSFEGPDGETDLGKAADFYEQHVLPLYDQMTQQTGFTGTVTASNGQEYHFKDGVRVAGPPKERPVKPEKAKPPPGQTKPASSWSGHPAAGPDGKVTAQGVVDAITEATRKHLQAGGANYNLKDPWGIKAAVPAGVDGSKVSQAISKAQQRVGPLRATSLEDAYKEAVREQPNLTVRQFQETLKALEREGKVRLEPWTRPMHEATQGGDQRAAYFFVDSSEVKAYVKPVQGAEEPKPDPTKDKADLLAAVDATSKQGGMASLHELGKRLGWPLERLHAAVNALRQEGALTGQASEGRGGRSEEERRYNLPEPGGAGVGAVGRKTPSAPVKPAAGFAYPAGYKPPPHTSPNAALPETSRPRLTAEEATAAQRYAHMDYAGINQAMRAGREVPRQYQATVDGLRSAFARAERFEKPVKTYRGLSIRPTELQAIAGQFQQAMSSGGVVELPGYQSTSTSLSPHFAGGGLTFQILAHKGLDLRPYSGLPDEDELLLDQGQRYHVRGMTKGEKGWIIDLEQIV